MKPCKGCGESKPLDAYYRRRSGPRMGEFIHTECIQCVKANRKARYVADDDYRTRRQEDARTRYWADPEAAREAVRRYKDANREQVNARQRLRDQRLNPNFARNQLKYRHGISPETWVAMLESQGGVCAICQADEPGGMGTWHVDHDHNCCPGNVKACGECFRGLLCSSCNHCLGGFRDSPEILERAAAYVRERSVSLNPRLRRQMRLVEETSELAQAASDPQPA